MKLSDAVRNPTLCLYMGCADIAAIAADLIAAGRAPATPALAAIDVEHPGATLLTSTLGDLAAALASLPTQAPVFIAIGTAAARPSAATRAAQRPLAARSAT
jgi:uroporphyrin-III C-methyltransferase / precorrin-2 dehydrogenase / sirohydrochlorin ferrochelatase